jgi:hypothetical protein
MSTGPSPAGWRRRYSGLPVLGREPVSRNPEPLRKVVLASAYNFLHDGPSHGPDRDEQTEGAEHEKRMERVI